MSRYEWIAAPASLTSRHPEQKATAAADAVYRRAGTAEPRIRGGLGAALSYAATAAVLRDAQWPKKPKPAKPRSIIAQVEGSGTGDAAGPKAISTVSVPTTGCGKVKVKARKVNAHGPTGDTRPGNGMPNTGRQLHPMGLCLEASPGIEPGCKDLQSSA